MNKITLISFGFKYGQPHANYYFDVGFLKNPARQDKWDFFSDTDGEMKDFLLMQPEALKFLELVEPLIVYLNSIDQNQLFAFGCSGGRHRSPIIVEVLAENLRTRGIQVNVRHRDK